MRVKVVSRNVSPFSTRTIVLSFSGNTRLNLNDNVLSCEEIPNSCVVNSRGRWEKTLTIIGLAGG